MLRVLIDGRRNLLHDILQVVFHATPRIAQHPVPVPDSVIGLPPVSDERLAAFGRVVLVAVDLHDQLRRLDHPVEKIAPDVLVLLDDQPPLPEPAEHLPLGVAVTADGRPPEQTRQPR